jgi:iron complex outermembrane receptor protein
LNHTPILKKRAIAAALAVAFSQTAFAQQAPAPEPKVQRVEITGSSIKRTETESAGSVQVLTRADIERTGATTALGVLTSIAGVDANINSATASSGSFATGSSGVELRNIGKVSTLVLVNGRRIAPYGLADGAQENFTNLDAIASEAIERIEVLKDGASAIYGSDAIAGVVNLILRKDYVGAKIKANYTTMDGFKDYRTRNVAAIVGWGDVEKNGFNTYLSVEGYRNDGWSTGDLRSSVPDWHRSTPGRSTWDAKSSFSPKGNYLVNGVVTASKACDPADIDPVDKACKWDALPYAGQTTSNERWAVASNTHFRIGSSIDAQFELTASGSKTDYIVAPFSTNNGGTTSSTSVWYNAIDGKMVGPFSYPKLPVGHPSNPYAVATEYRARLMDTGDGFNFNKTDANQSRAMLSLSGSLGNYDWKSAAGYMISDATKATRAVSAKGYTDAIVNKTYKFGQTNDTALLESMFPVRTTAGKSKTYFIDGTITGEAAQLPAGPLNFAVGADVRHQSYEMASSDNVLRGDLVGIFGLQVKDTQTQYAVFGEAVAPLLKRVELTAALRADKSGEADVHVSPKLGLKINALDSLLLRATASGGFRAPNIVETGNGLGRSSVATNVNDLRRCPIATELNNIVQKAAGATTIDKQRANTFRNNDCLAGLPSFVSSNPELKPETSKSFTVGAVWEPLKNTWLSLDFFKIERKDEIGTRTVADVLRAEASLPAGQLVRIDSSAADNEFLSIVKKYAPATTTNFGGIGSLGLVYNPYVNSGKTRVSGFDFEGATKYKLEGIGDLSVKLEGVYNWKYQVFDVGTGEYGRNYFGSYDYGPRLRTKLRPTLKTGDLTQGLTIHYSSGYANNSEDSPTYCETQKVAAEFMGACNRVNGRTVVDYNVNYRGIKGTTLALYINNLFDREQAVRWRDGYSFTSPGMRTIGVTAAYEFK